MQTVQIQPAKRKKLAQRPAFKDDPLMRSVMRQLGHQLRAEMQERGITGAEMARRLGVNHSTVSNAFTKPYLHTLCKIAEQLDLDVKVRIRVVARG